MDKDTQIETERKFLVKFPQSWLEVSEMFDNLLEIRRLTQTYLKPKGKEPSARVRKTVQGFKDTETFYDFNQKKPIEEGVHEEKEFEISESEYKDYLKDPHPDKITIRKTRFVFKYEKQVFELDVFKDALSGLAILEIELEDKDDPVKLPPFLNIVKEVTKDKKYSNFALADKKLYQNK